MPNRREFRTRGRGYSPRPVDTRNVLQRFLIVCEGEKTEPNYFRAFRVPKEVADIRGLGDNTVGLVQRTLELRKEDVYDQVWCVFDRDSFPAERFNQALALARQNSIQVAYSSEAFELWYLLHFHYYDAAITRAQYRSRLTALLGRPYQKNSESIYDELESRRPDAIRNASRLLEQYEPPNPERDNPSTTVHLLVMELNRFLR